MNWKRLKDPDTLFYLAFGIYLVTAILNTSFYAAYLSGTDRQIIRYVWATLLLIREIWKRDLNEKSVLLAAVLLFFIIATRITTTKFTLSFILIFVFAARNVEFDKIARFAAVVTGIVVAFVVISSMLGVIQNYTYMDGTRFRQLMGFRNTSAVPSYMFNITCLSLCVNRDRLKWRLFLVLVGINALGYAWTVTRLPFGMSMLVILVFACYKLCPTIIKNRRKLLMLLVASFLVCFVVSLTAVVCYSDDIGWMYTLNRVLEHRLSLAQSSLIENGFGAFGQKLLLIGNGLDTKGIQFTGTYNYVDCLYVQMLQRYGVLFMAFWLGLMTCTIYRFWKKRDYLMVLCLAILAAHGMIDDRSMSLYYNTFWLATGIVLYGENGVCRPIHLPWQTKTRQKSPSEN